MFIKVAAEEFQSIDEIMIASKENSNLRQNVLVKPNKLGLNVPLNSTRTFPNHKDHKTFAVNFLQAFHFKVMSDVSIIKVRCVDTNPVNLISSVIGIESVGTVK